MLGPSLRVLCRGDDDPDFGGHGVHTAGTIGAEGNSGIGITGVAPNVRIMPLRVCSRAQGEDDCPSSKCPLSRVIDIVSPR
jgi:subtilisin family serine protease